MKPIIVGLTIYCSTGFLAVQAQEATFADHGPAQVSEGKRCLRFPSGAIRRNANGTVKFSMTIAADSTVHVIAMTLSSGDQDLDDIASECVNNPVFQPAIRGGQPIEYRQRHRHPAGDPADPGAAR